MLGIYVIHSLVDYPLRTLSHAALLGMFAGLMPITTKRQRHQADLSTFSALPG